jgi:hypothetical protein
MTGSSWLRTLKSTFGHLWKKPVLTQLSRQKGEKRIQTLPGNPGRSPLPDHGI